MTPDLEDESLLKLASSAFTKFRSFSYKQEVAHNISKTSQANPASPIAIPHYLFNNFEIEEQRFKIWASNLGLLSSGHASLDYKLRRAPHLIKVVKRLLGDIIESLTDLLASTDDSRSYMANSHQGAYDKARNESLSEPSGKTKSDSESDVESNSDDDEPDKTETIKILLDEICDANNKLYRIATDIRDSSVRSGVGDRNHFKRFCSSDAPECIESLISIERKVIDEHINHYISTFVKPEQQCRPENEDEHDMLLTKLGRHNAFRRLQFAYWRAEVEERENALDRRIAEFQRVKKQSTRSVKEFASEQWKKIQEPSITPSNLGPSVVHSTSTLNPEKFQRKTAPSAYSRITRAPVAAGPDGQRPTWPGREDLPEIQSAFFQCPFCFALCPEDYRSSDSAWRSVLNSQLSES